MKQILIPLTFCLLVCTGLQAQPDRFFETNTNAGTEYYLSCNAAWPTAGQDNAIKIYISSNVETDVIVEVKSDGFYKKIKTIANDIIQVSIPPVVAQPYFKTDKQPTPADGVYQNKAIHVLADAPIVCYCMTRYQYTSDGYLGIPVSALGKEYIIASYADIGDNGAGIGQYLPSQTNIVAPYDNTEVTFTLGGNMITKTSGDGQGLNGLTPGQSKSWLLMKGDVLSISSFGNEADLSGSKVVATKPVAVISGNYCAYIPTDVAACDFITEMELPTHIWGRAYHVTPIFGRVNNSYIKIFAKYPNTKIYRDGQLIGTIAQAGGIENYGFLNRRVSDGPARNFIISSDPGHPISVTQFNPGQLDDGVPSDPFQMVLIPVEQFQTEITFNTPGIGNGTGFAKNYVNLVYEPDANGQMPDDLEFAKVVSGQFTWQPVKQFFGSSVGAMFAQPINGVNYAMTTLELPNDGVYKIRAQKPFAAYAYGFSAYDSYGHPAAAFLNALDASDTTAPVPLFAVGKDGSVTNGLIQDFSTSSGTQSYLSKIVMAPKESFNYTFTSSPFISGQDSTASWSLKVNDSEKPAKATLVFLDRAGNDTMVTISYAPSEVDVPENNAPRGLFVSPNPVSKEAVVSYQLDAPALIHVSLFSFLGEEVLTETSEQQAGEQHIRLHVANLSPGLYFCHLNVGKTTKVVPIVVE